MKKDLLIVEKIEYVLENKKIETRSDGKQYVILEGIFGVLNEMNRNNRIYTADQYLPQIKNLQPRILENKVTGELGHPIDRFDNDLSKVSHVVETLYFDEKTNQVRGKIRLLNTPSGKIAQSLVEDGIPLHISSRAAGSVNEDGTVTIKRLFTYDIVDEPGFAKAELSRVNEKYGYGDESFISLYEVNSSETASREEGIYSQDNSFEKNNLDKNIYNKNINEMEYVSKDAFNKYSNYLKEQILSLNEKLDSIKETPKSNDFDPSELKEQIGNVIRFTNYLSEKMNSSIAHGDHVVENVLNLKKYVNHLAENLDANISYGKYVSGHVDKLISHNNHIVENLGTSLQYQNYLAENLNSLIDSNENTVKYIEYVAEGADKGIQYSEMVAEKLDQGLQYSEEIGRIVNERANYSDYLGTKINESINYQNYVSESLNKGSIARTPQLNESYELSISNKLDTLLNEAKNQNAYVTNNKLHFLSLLNEDKRIEFNSLSDLNKQRLIEAFENNGYYTSADVLAIYNTTVNPYSEEPTIVRAMKSHHRVLWEALSDTKKYAILEQSRNYVLNTPEKIDAFWDHVDLRNTKVELNQLHENNQNNKLTKQELELNLPSNDFLRMFESAMSDKF